MNFKLKKKKPIITFSCFDWAIRTHSPVLPAEEFLPEEFHTMQVGKVCPFDTKKLNSDLTIKNCPAVNNFIKSGYIIRAWCDIEVDFVDDQIKIQYSNTDYGHEVHTMEQFGDVINQQFQVRLDIKLNSPWHIQTAPGYSCMWLPIFYMSSNYQALPAIIETDLNLNQNPINLMFFKPVKTLIKMGDPLVQVVPFKRENITGVSKKFDTNDENRLRNILNLRKLSRFSWRSFIQDKVKYKLQRKNLDIDND